jgi:serine/threonine protein kinase
MVGSPYWMAPQMTLS